MAGSSHFYDYELGIYMAGMAGMKPRFPMDMDELEQRARELIDPQAYWYVAGGAGTGNTVCANREAFHKWQLVPRLYNDVSERDWRTTVCKTHLNAPVMLAPVGVQEIVHDEAEMAVARGAKSVGVGLCLSTLSSNTMEDVAHDLGETPRWFQLYPPKDNNVAKSFIARAEKSGYEAIVVTVDTRLMGYRVQDLQEAYLPFLEGKGIANYLSDPAFRASLDEPPEANPQGAIAKWADIYSDQSQTWDYIRFVRDNTTLPVLVKGILHPDEARECVEIGVDGIVVSNHGGRQLDGCISALDALPPIAEAVGDKADLVVDSGIRGGSDIIKALALGAKAVFIGRPYVYGLAVGGQDGVEDVLKRILCEFDLNCALCGFTEVSQISREILRRAD